MYGEVQAQSSHNTLQKTNQVSVTNSSDYAVVPVDTITTIDGVEILEEILRDTVPAPNTSVSASPVHELSKEKKTVVSPANAVASTRSGARTSFSAVSVSAMKQMDSLITQYRSALKGFSDRWDDIYLPAPKGVRSDPDFYKLSMPATYYSAAIEEAMSIDDWKPRIAFVREDTLRKMVFQVPDLERSKRIDKAINGQLLRFYVNYPNLVKKNESQLEGLEPLADKYVVKRPKKDKVLNLVQKNLDKGSVSESELLVMKPNFWAINGKGDLQFSQNYISDNWYKGGESTKSLFAQMEWQFNYNDKQRVQFENKIEWKLGFITTPSDTVHSYRANNDLFRISSKLGIKAAGNWYYTLSGEFKTQFFSSYATNSNDLISTFFSPAELNFGIGMDYKYVKNNCNLSVLVNPLNYTRYSVSSDRVDPTKFNIDAGKKEKNQLGSRLETTLKWKLMQNLLWESRLSYTTDYSGVLSEWENTFTFSFNRYFSTKLFAHGRFDDTVSREPDESYFQLQEQLSLGLTYTW